MITTINKDILTVDNCLGAVGGLAGAIARKWPKNVQEYQKHVNARKQSVTLLGSILEVNVAHNLIVANLFGQYGIGTSRQQTEYAALISGFKTVANTGFWGNDKEEVDFGSFGMNDVPNVLKDIYIPYKIGCGLGGADWNLVEEIIEKIFQNSYKNVFICKI
jgi:O-acetyl-ADP-ribose deacetylase (regulator of RNase III)